MMSALYCAASKRSERWLTWLGVEMAHLVRVEMAHQVRGRGRVGLRVRDGSPG